jgi:CheY-like chemotaxis protein
MEGRLVQKSVLIIDDEKNIRLTLSHSLESLGLETDTAVNGEEALTKIRAKNFDLMFLDLKLPGMDGMEVLRQVREIRPAIRIIIITAYGTIESAVEAMKLGAVDFIQKPFTPNEIRELVSQIGAREDLEEHKAEDYTSLISLMKKCIGERHFDVAVEHARKATSLDPTRPEAYNLLGVLMEIKGEDVEAQKNYRIALSIDPTYEQARKNLYRLTSWKPPGNIILGETKAEEKRKGN